MAYERQDVPVDRFALRFMVLGNEIIGFEVDSTSPKRNWAFFGIMAMFAVAALISAMEPAITRIAGAG